MKKLLKKGNGITLIALVITIVVLIILASVAINITVGENGIFNRAIQAKEQFEMAAVKEKLNLAILEIQTGEAISGDDLTLDIMLTKLQEKLPGIELEKDGETLKGTLDGYDFVIDSDFKVTIEGYNPETKPEIYTVTFNGDNVTSDGLETVTENATYTANLSLTSGYGVTSVSVKMGDTDLTQGTHFTYADGVLTIERVTGNIEITVVAEKIQYTVTFNGENVTSNGAEHANEIESYTATLTSGSGYNITNVAITMNGTALTSGTDYTYENGSLTIPNVTGNIEITVTTEIIVSVTELTSYDQEGTLLTYSWEELEEVANVISNNPSIITNDTMGARVTIGVKTYEVKVGNLVAVTYNSETYNTKIVGFNHDTLASDTTKTAGISFVFEDVLYKAKMNSTDANTTGWGGSALRTEVNNITLKTSSGVDLPIKEVKKTYLLGGTTNSANPVTTTVTSNDKLWLLSCSEIWDNGIGTNVPYGYAAGKEGEQYKYYKILDASAGTVTTDLVKKYEGTAAPWWLRSPGHYRDDVFCTVYSNGVGNTGLAGSSYGVVPGFAI